MQVRPRVRLMPTNTRMRFNAAAAAGQSPAATPRFNAA